MDDFTGWNSDEDVEDRGVAPEEHPEPPMLLLRRYALRSGFEFRNIVLLIREPTEHPLDNLPEWIPREYHNYNPDETSVYSRSSDSSDSDETIGSIHSEELDFLGDLAFRRARRFPLEEHRRYALTDWEILGLDRDLYGHLPPEQHGLTFSRDEIMDIFPESRRLYLGEEDETVEEVMSDYSSSDSEFSFERTSDRLRREEIEHLFANPPSPPTSHVTEFFNCIARAEAEQRDRDRDRDRDRPIPIHEVNDIDIDMDSGDEYERERAWRRRNRFLLRASRDPIIVRTPQRERHGRISRLADTLEEAVLASERRHRVVFNDALSDDSDSSAGDTVFWR
jgi:hypothetical protein